MISTFCAIEISFVLPPPPPRGLCGMPRLQPSRRLSAIFPPTLPWHPIHVRRMGGQFFSETKCSIYREIPSFLRHNSHTTEDSLQFRKRLNFSINPRKLSKFYWSFSDQSDALKYNILCYRSDWLGLCLFCSINPCVLSSNRVDLGFFFLFHKFFNFTPPPPPESSTFPWDLAAWPSPSPRPATYPLSMLTAQPWFGGVSKEYSYGLGVFSSVILYL